MGMVPTRKYRIGLFHELAWMILAPPLEAFTQNGYCF